METVKFAGELIYLIANIAGKLEPILGQSLTNLQTTTINC